MFCDRRDAGRRLAVELAHYAGQKDVVVLGIPRGGVPVAFEIAQALRAPLDILIVRKLGAPGQKELAMGAIASGGARFLNRQIISELGVTEAELAETIAAQEAELQRREQVYRGARPGLPLAGKTAILVDDGIATGSSMLAAIEALRSLQPKKIVVAVPVAPPDAFSRITAAVDEFICVLKSEWFFAIGQFYEDFQQVEDEEVSALLVRAAEAIPTTSAREEKGAA